MNQPGRVRFWLIIGAMLVVLFIVFDLRAQQDHSCQGGHNCNDGGAVIAEIAGDDFRALSVSQALGAAAISGCIVTTQWGIPIIFQRQSFHYDVFCLARELDKAKKYDDAAAMRCTHKDTAKLYGERCLDVMNYEPPEIDPLDILVGQVPDDRYAEQQEEIEFAREERASLVGQIDRLTQQIEQQPVVQQIDNGAIRRAKSREAYEEALKGSEQ